METTQLKRRQKSAGFADSLERIPTRIFPAPSAGSKWVAAQVAAEIKAKKAAGDKCVLGLATGSTPKLLYQELVRLHREEGLSFAHVVAFNLDEYYPIEKDALQSYHRFMRTHLFDHIDINPANCFIPDGEMTKDKIKAHCAAYENIIAAYGGLDIQILGIGVNGHIGFNEPGSSIHSKTRMVSLDNSTRLANAYEFSGISDVPRLAITMGINTILKAKKIILMGWGNAKAPVIQKAVEEDVTESIPASLLQTHDDVTFVVDELAAAHLTRFKSPWLTGEIEWTPDLVKRAVVHTALQLGKPILSLTNNDYNEHGLGELLVEKGDAYEINLQVFYMLRDSITGWPGGKPNANIPAHPERSEPYPKRILIFSPHPDDDIISMGGTFQRLHDQGHEVHVAYQTSGNIAVTDEFVTRFLDFAIGFETLFGGDGKLAQDVLVAAKAFLQNKKSNQSDTQEIRSIKGLIRRCEAAATCRYVGIKESGVHFLNLPFYETGAIEKAPMSKEDIQITTEVLRQVKPHQIFAAGDLADPHGTHRVCLDVILEALKRIKAEGDEWVADCWLWLYKGAWQEWNIDEIEMAVPMSPDQVRQKRFGIFIHQSQKDMVPFQGSDAREFWQRAEDRNAATADVYAQLGLTRYAAMEAFVRWHF